MVHVRAETLGRHSQHLAPIGYGTPPRPRAKRPRCGRSVLGGPSTRRDLLAMNAGACLDMVPGGPNGPYPGASSAFFSMRDTKPV